MRYVTGRPIHRNGRNILFTSGPTLVQWDMLMVGPSITMDGILYLLIYFWADPCAMRYVNGRPIHRNGRNILFTSGPTLVQ
jgi:myosin-crossreactive antigen